MSEKRVVSRNVAIVLGIICIVLAISLVGAIANYTSIISGKDNAIASLNSQITDKSNMISSLNSQVSDLTDTVNLAKSTIWINDETVSEPANSYTHWTGGFSASYAGYVSVTVHTSTTSNTYVRVIYSSHDVNYDHQISVGRGGTAVFPILPASNVEIRVGNSDWFNGATETVTITYNY